MRSPTAEVSWRLGWDPPPPRTPPGHSEEPFGWTPPRYLLSCKLGHNLFLPLLFLRIFYNVLSVVDNPIPTSLYEYHQLL